jgi:hypothetical protein
MAIPSSEPRSLSLPAGPSLSPLKRVEHYALALLNGMAAGGSSGLSDSDIDYAIDVAERLALKLAERGHIAAHD